MGSGNSFLLRVEYLSIQRSSSLQLIAVPHPSGSVPRRVLPQLGADSVALERPSRQRGHKSLLFPAPPLDLLTLLCYSLSLTHALA